MKRNGVLLVHEGISGSGKSEGIARLRNYLISEGIDSTVVEWNSNTLIRNWVRRLQERELLTPAVYSFMQWLSFVITYISVIRPLLRSNRIVIADRYVYTGVTRDSVNGSGQTLGRLISRVVRTPDLVVFYDTPPTICLERIRERGKALFHPNRALCNRDLIYLTSMRSQYICLFAKQSVEVVVYPPDYTARIGMDVERHVEQIIRTLMGIRQKQTAINRIGGKT